ncbi:MAG: type II toxin-antitoxin system VapC family toxin [Candidatus Eisenbacteria bacterium]|nr:type II toxin-antitoxin system VapC family toxin [Candidatus Eisenbacteria bacterium]
MSGGLAERLRGLSRIHLDTNVLIYYLQDEPPYGALVRPVFERIASGSLSGMTSFITLLEILVKPLRDGRADLVRQYADVLLNAQHLMLQPVERTIAETGAEIRAKYNVRTPDAIQLATAVRGGAQAFLTNDRRLAQVRNPEVVVLDDYVEPAR